LNWGRKRIRGREGEKIAGGKEGGLGKNEVTEE